MSRLQVFTLALFAAFAAAGAVAQESQRPAGAAGAPPTAGQPAPAQQGPLPPPSAEPNMTLEALLAQVTRGTGREYIIAASARRDVYVGGIAPRDITYPILLSILRANGLAATEISGRIYVEPDYNARSLPTRIVQVDATDVPDDEIVTMMVQVHNAMAAQFVPVLRPMLPMSAHLAAYVETNTLIIVDRFSNARRIAEVVMALDSMAPPQGGQ